MGNTRFLKVAELRVQYIGGAALHVRTERSALQLLSISVDFSACSFAKSFSVESSHAAGPGTEDSDAASVRADHCVPHASGIYYFEIEVVPSHVRNFHFLGWPVRSL